MAPDTLDPEVLERTRKVVATTLDQPLASIEPQAGFFTDLEAESIDVVDLVCRLEEEFDLRIEVGELMNEEFFEGAARDGDRPLTKDEMDELRRDLPFLGLAPDATVQSTALRGLFTVEALARFAALKTAEKAEQAVKS